MKLAKKLSIAAASIALSFAAVSAKPAQAASVNFVSQLGGTYNYNVLATGTPSEKLLKSASITLSGLEGVTGVNVNSSFLNLVGFDANNVFLTLKKATANTLTGNPFTGLDFSVVSSFTTPSPVSFSVLSGTNFNAGNTTGPSDVPEPMTVGGSLLAVGFGTWMKRKKAESAQKA
ncbi:PEP-CTERM sorting domain-containing protein [Nostoc sp. 106C]|uniref:PEP-CTERM sorting domain-containing protein n=1 Tax=Nostoc sp. 106C TaxID=1932667 RepID=UPI000A36BCC4|nr:PEP-CTERM sorting domain-containing protein [Nostoc sp. 106C]OUL22800.1 hypothetical protein BV378_23045 [Nostoc sp. RF31YmG]OUL26859.1 hypothetical protein BV375_20645 [Nostoc sp. 106C]